MAVKKRNKRATDKARTQASELMTRYFYPLDDARSQYVDTWIDLYKRYEGYLEDQAAEDEWKANLPDFFTFPFVHAMTAYTHQAFFGASPYVSVELYTHGRPYTPEEDRFKKAIEETLNQQFDEAGFSQDKSMVLFADAFLYGTAIGKTVWEKKEVARIYLTPEGKVIQNTPVFDGPKVKPIKLWDFWADPMISSIGDASVVIERYILDLAEFNYEVARGYFEDVDITPIPADALGAADTNEIFTEVGETTVTWMDPNKVEILEIWVKGYGELGKVYWIANRQAVVKESENWLWSNEFPYTVFRPIPVNGKFYGLSPIWVARGAIDELMTHKALRLDNIKLHLVPMWKATGSINPDDLKVRMNGIVWCETRGDDVEPFRCNYVSVGVAEEEQLVQMVKFVLGFSELMAGVAPQTSIFRTALGASTFTQSAFNRLGLVKNSLGVSIGDIASKFIELDYQYVTEPLRVVLGDLGETVLDPEVMRLVKQCYPIAALDPNKQVQRQALVNFLQIAGQTPLAQRLPWDALWKEIVYLFNFQDKGAFKLLPPTPMPSAPPGAGGGPGQQGQEAPAILQALMRQASQGGAGAEGGA